MNDLRNIAQQLRLPADQLRTAADLLEQGYQPAFIARYRADEAGSLPGSVLWTLKFALERQHQLDTARKEAMAHLGEGVELDDEGRERVERARTTVDIDVALRCFRARRAARQSGERSGQASQLLEKMIAATAPVTDMTTWVAEQLATEPDQSEALVQQCSRLIGSLLGGDTRLMERMRLAIQKKASIKVENQTEAPAKSGKSDKESNPSRAGGAHTAQDDDSGSDAHDHDHESNSEAWAHHDDDLVGDHSDQAERTESAEHAEAQLDAAHPDSVQPDVAQSDAEHSSVIDASSGEQATAGEQPAAGQAGDHPAATSVGEGGADDATVASAESDVTKAESTASEPAPSSETIAVGEAAPISLTFATGKKPREAKLSTGKRKERTQVSAKSLAKLTPRQRRRRWLNSVLQPFRSLKKPLHRLTSYQMLMLGRGQRSQLIRVDLDYDRRALLNMARDVFVNDSHPLARWFGEACEQALSGGLFAKVEADALAEEDELAQQKLLEAATDQLRVSLLQRPVKGHRILVVDTVGPNSSCIAIIDARGKCMATQEVVCSSQPSVVSQNVIMLGELVHKHKVTLVALSNGPARRFLVHTVAELMKQSTNGRLRWTMVDRGGAEAYATSRQASVELPQLNRRFRAAVWLGRRLQDPLGELLKLDTSRLRLGSYQRELPQEPLKRLVTATLSDCLCVKGVDARYASEQQFSYVPGVSAEIAARLAEVATKREFVSREALLADISNWSETGKRQALGFLRIYQSPQTLDGTLIHPDDYRLAQRLIEGTELVEPPAAPEGWLPPRVKAAKPSKNFGADPAAGAESGMESTNQGVSDSAQIAAGAVVASGSTSGSSDESPAESIAPASSETSVSLEASSPDAGTGLDATASSVDSSESTAAKEADVSSNMEAGAAAATPSQDSTDTNDPMQGADASAGSEERASGGAQSGIVPEYSEDVIINQAIVPMIDVEKLARSWQVGRAKLAWLAECLAEPFGDMRDERPPVPMLAAVPTLADLQPGMSVYAIVVGVAEFGAFVELGPDCGGLIHISRLSARYIEDPHQAVQIGDLIQAWVVSVDVEKKRVALTALSPQQQQQQAEAQRAHDQARAAENRGPRSGGHSGGGHSGSGHGSAQQSGGGNVGSQQSGSGHSGGQRGGGQYAGSPSGGGQRTGGQYAGGGQGRGGRPGGQGGQGQGGGGGQGSGGGRPGGGQRRDRGGAPGGGHGRGGRPGGGESRPIVVKSKKPSAPITDAMKKGQEPLRSFSDLMQYFEVQRTDTPAAAPVVVEPKPSSQLTSQLTSQPAAESQAKQEPQSESTANE